MKEVAALMASVLLLTLCSHGLVATTTNPDRNLPPAEPGTASLGELDSIEIVTPRGGLGLSVGIGNTGESVVNNLAWSIAFSKPCLGKNSTGTIGTLAPGNATTIRTGFVFGLGPGSVRITVGEYALLQNYLMLGPFVIVKRAWGNQIKNPDVIIRYDDAEAQTLDPADSYDDASFEPIQQIYETLVTYNGNDTKTFVPALATSWTVSADSLTWTFQVRHPVKFSNGDDCTAEDVKYSFDRVLTMGSPTTGVSWILSQCMGINSTTVLDDSAVQITLTQPYGGFLALLAQPVASIVDKDYVEAHGGVVPGEANLWMTEHPMGTGPYELDHWTQASAMAFNRNPLYWGGWEGRHPVKVVINYVNDSAARIDALKQGNADFASVPSEDLDEFIGEKGVVVHPFDNYKVSVMMINTHSGNALFLNDGRVRRAFSYAFDYNASLQDAWNGYASRLIGPIPRGMPYDDTQNNGQPSYTFDLMTAGQILDAAGYPRDFDINGTLYRFNGTIVRIFYNSLNVEREVMALLFKEALLDIGVRCLVTAEDWPQYLNRIYQTNEWEMAFLGWTQDYNDPDDYIVPFIGSTVIGGDALNTGYRNDIVDQELLEARRSADPTVRAAAYKAAFDVYIQEPSLLFLAQLQFIQPWRDWVQHYTYNPVHEWRYYDYYKAYE